LYRDKRALSVAARRDQLHNLEGQTDHRHAGGSYLCLNRSSILLAAPTRLLNEAEAALSEYQREVPPWN
jgi:hypothetical protein